jgi:hypothetical protein
VAVLFYGPLILAWGDSHNQEQDDLMDTSPVDISGTGPALQRTRELLKTYDVNPDELNPGRLQRLATQPTDIQAQAAEAYAASMKGRQNAVIDAKPNSVPEETSKEHGKTPVESSLPAQGHQKGMGKMMAQQYYNYTSRGIGVCSVTSPFGD